MSSEIPKFDVVVIGGGPGGYAAALYGASAGCTVALVEQDKVGGTCLHRGCIPAKELLESASVYRTIGHAQEFGISVEVRDVDWAETVARKARVVEQMFSGLSGLLKSRKVQVYSGTARLEVDHMVTVTTSEGVESIRGDAIVIATGSTPRVLAGFEPDGVAVFSSDEFLDMTVLPQRAAVIGGGAIGCEFASTLADMGAEVTILEGLDKILPGCDADITKLVERSFKKKGIAIRTGASVASQERLPSGAVVVTLADGSSLEVDAVVVSIGRTPNAHGVATEATGVSVSDRGFIEVDQHCATGAAGVWAVGDCIATPQLAHVAFMEGMNAIRSILGEAPPPIDYLNVPWAIYCQPEVAFAGHSEESAKAAGFEVVTAKHRFLGNGRAVILGQTDGMVKVIAEREADGTAGRILGVHMIGPWVTEQLGQGYLAVNWGATVADVASLIQPHPTLSELFGEAVLSLTGRSLH